MKPDAWTEVDFTWSQLFRMVKLKLLGKKNTLVFMNCKFKIATEEDLQRFNQ